MKHRKKVGLTLKQQADAIANNAPTGEHALDEYERNVHLMMDEETLWPISDRPANPFLAELAGFDVEDDEFDNFEDP